MVGSGARPWVVGHVFYFTFVFLYLYLIYSTIPLQRTIATGSSPPCAPLFFFLSPPLLSSFSLSPAPHFFFLPPFPFPFLFPSLSFFLLFLEGPSKRRDGGVLLCLICIFGDSLLAAFFPFSFY